MNLPISPYNIVLIRWADASHDSSSRLPIPPHTYPSIIPQVTVGWLVHEDEDCVEVAQVLEPHPSKENEWLCGFIETIPRGMIVKRERWNYGDN